MTQNTKKFELEFDINDLKTPNKCATKKEALEQIIEDMDEFKKYLKNSIYYASGIEAFFQQEINEISNNFKIEEQETRGWQYLIFETIEKKNSKIPKEMIEKFNFEVSKKQTFFEKYKEIEDFTKEFKKKNSTE